MIKIPVDHVKVTILYYIEIICRRIVQYCSAALKGVVDTKNRVTEEPWGQMKATLLILYTIGR